MKYLDMDISVWLVIGGTGLIAALAIWFIYTKRRNDSVEADGERLHTDITSAQEAAKPITASTPVQETISEDKLEQLQSRYAKGKDSIGNVVPEKAPHAKAKPAEASKSAKVESLRTQEADAEIKEHFIKDDGGDNAA